MKKAFCAALLLIPAPVMAGNDPTVTRVDSETVQLDWSGWSDGKPVSASIADHPDAPDARRKKLAVPASAGSMRVHVAQDGRPYFLLKTNGTSRWVAERQIALSGGDNFRDVGGYETDDGRVVRWGKLYRSASVARYTPADQALVRKLGVGSIIDLRSSRERQSDTAPWMQSAGLGYWTRDYDLSGGNLGALFSKDTKLDAEIMRKIMLQGYRGFPKEQAASYRKLFEQLLASDQAVIVNCTAGKDRTGLGMALVLSALGVPYDTIMGDYLLSNTALDMDALRADAGMNAAMAALPADVAKPLLGVERAYLDAAFDQINKDYGSVDTYLARELGVDHHALQRLRKQMLS